MSKEAQVDKKEIGALLEELDGRHRQALRSSDDASDALDFLHAMEAHYPELRAYIRKAEKVIAAARAYQAAVLAVSNSAPVKQEQWRRKRETGDDLAAALADLDEGDTE